MGPLRSSHQYLAPSEKTYQPRTNTDMRGFFAGLSGSRNCWLVGSASPRRSRRSARCSVGAAAASHQPVEKLDRHELARIDLAARVLEHDEAVRLRHRAQHAGALLPGSAHFPLAAFAEEDAALVFGAAGHF